MTLTSIPVVKINNSLQQIITVKMLLNLLFSSPLSSHCGRQLSTSPMLQVSHSVFGRTNIVTAEIKKESEITVVKLIQSEWRMLYSFKEMEKKIRM